MNNGSPEWKHAQRQARALVTAATSYEPNAVEVSRGVLHDVLTEIQGDGAATGRLILALDILAANAVTLYADEMGVSASDIMQRLSMGQEGQ